MNQKKTAEEYLQDFENYYKEFLQRKSDKEREKEKEINEIIAKNSMCIENFQKECNLDNKSINLLPGYFNYIECYLELQNFSEVKRYLIVGLSNLMFSSKKKDDSKADDALESDELDEIKIQKIKLRSKLDLLFARYNLAIKNYENAIEKLTNSIILASRIYSPESPELTGYYYYLARYFILLKEKDIVVINILLKIAEVWKMYFMNNKNIIELDCSGELLFIVGEFYVKKIARIIRQNLGSDTELDFKFKIIRVLIMKAMKNDIYKENLTQAMKLKDSPNISDKAFLPDLNDILYT